MMQWVNASLLGGRSVCAKDWWVTLWERQRKMLIMHQGVQFPRFGSRVTTDEDCHPSLFAEGTVPKKRISPSEFLVAALKRVTVENGSPFLWSLVH